MRRGRNYEIFILLLNIIVIINSWVFFGANGVYLGNFLILYCCLSNAENFYRHS